MSDPESVIRALRNLREAAQPVPHPVPEEGFPPSCQDFVGICLMAHVKDNLVLRGIEDIMQPDNQFHGAKA